MNADTMRKLVALRRDVGFPLPVSSAYRCPSHPSEAGKDGKHPGAHAQGQGVDILVSGRRAYRVLEAAFRHGFTGIGVSQRGPHESRFVHLDDLPGRAQKMRPAVWSY